MNFARTIKIDPRTKSLTAEVLFFGRKAKADYTAQSWIRKAAFGHNQKSCFREKERGGGGEEREREGGGDRQTDRQTETQIDRETDRECLAACLPACLSACPSVRLSVSPSVCLSIYLSVPNPRVHTHA